ncbi:MAG: hypothetical protein QXR63_00125 [Candidatus Bathyarchaeia archaeon]
MLIGVSKNRLKEYGGKRILLYDDWESSEKTWQTKQIPDELGIQVKLEKVKLLRNPLEQGEKRYENWVKIYADKTELIRWVYNKIANSCRGDLNAT